MSKEITLSDGRKAVIRKGKVKDMIFAFGKACDPNNQMDITVAMISELTTIDGKALLYEDFKEMYIDDGNKLLVEFATMGKSMEDLKKLYKFQNSQVGV